MPSVTYLPVDGEITRYGDFTQRDTAVVFRDASGTALIIAAPSGDTISFDIASAAEMTLSATVLNVQGNDIDMGTLGARIDMDTDNDTSIRCSADDVLEIEVAGADTVAFDAVGIKLGTLASFSTTAGTNGIVFAAGTAPNGTITTACQLYSDNSGDDLSVEHADGTEDELTT